MLDTKGGFVLAHWDGTPETEERIKEETKATIRCIALATEPEAGTCMVTGKPSTRRVILPELTKGNLLPTNKLGSLISGKKKGQLFFS